VCASVLLFVCVHVPAGAIACGRVCMCVCVRACVYLYNPKA